MPDPTDAPDPYPGVHTPESLAAVRRANAAQQARWAQAEAEKNERRAREIAEKRAKGETFVDQLRLAFTAEPFRPFVFGLTERLRFYWLADDPDLPTVRFLDDAVMWDHGDRRCIVPFRSILWVDFLSPEPPDITPG